MCYHASLSCADALPGALQEGSVNEAQDCAAAPKLQPRRELPIALTSMSNRNTPAFRNSRNCNKTQLIPIFNRNNNSVIAIYHPLHALRHRRPRFRANTFLIVAIAIKKRIQPIETKGQPCIPIVIFHGVLASATRQLKP
jgi:hypothetical protein